MATPDSIKYVVFFNEAVSDPHGGIHGFTKGAAISFVFSTFTLLTAIVLASGCRGYAEDAF